MSVENFYGNDVKESDVQGLLEDCVDRYFGPEYWEEDFVDDICGASDEVSIQSRLNSKIRDLIVELEEDLGCSEEEVGEGLSRLLDAEDASEIPEYHIGRIYAAAEMFSELCGHPSAYGEIIELYKIFINLNSEEWKK